MKHGRSNLPWQQRGFSLIELMLALAIGTVLSFGVCNLFLHSTLSARQDAQMARLQENGRYALRYLGRELGMAGYLGTALWGERIAYNPDGTDCFDHLLEARTSFEHYDNVESDGRPGGGGEALPGGCRVGSDYVAGSDILLVRRTLDSPSVAGGTKLAGLDSDSIYLRVDTDAGTARFEPGGGPLSPAVDVLEYYPQILFLRNFSISPGDGIPALCRRRLAPRGNRIAPVECLVEGIEELQFEFGIDDDGDQRVDRYVDTVSPLEAGSAVVARIYILARSVHTINRYQSRQTHTLGGKVIPAANDGYYRRVVQTTVLLRNASTVKT